jgi:hypothetical protein
MENIFLRRGSEFSEREFWRFFLMPAFITFFLSGCDSERDKEWKKWMIEVDKVDFRCGTIGDYEIKINKAYLFYWPTYEGRSDWESNPPPPLTCSAKLKMMPFEAYWPGMLPAGRRPLSITLSGVNEPNYISISITAFPHRPSWSISTLLNSKARDGGNPQAIFGKYINTQIGLYRTEKPYRNSKLSSQVFYWEPDSNGTDAIEKFITCDLSDNRIVNSCVQRQYLPWLEAILEIEYERPQLKNWKAIARDTEEFLKNNSIFKGN